MTKVLKRKLKDLFKRGLRWVGRAEDVQKKNNFTLVTSVYPQCRIWLWGGREKKRNFTGVRRILDATAGEKKCVWEAKRSV